MELPEAVISLAGFPRESTANKYSYLRSSRTLKKRGARVAKHRYFVFFRSPPSLDVNRVGRVLSEYTIVVLLFFFPRSSLSFLYLEETERNSARIEFIFPYVHQVTEPSFVSNCFLKDIRSSRLTDRGAAARSGRSSSQVCKIRNAQSGWKRAIGNTIRRSRDPPLPTDLIIPFENDTSFAIIALS